MVGVIHLFNNWALTIRLMFVCRPYKRLVSLKQQLLLTFSLAHKKYGHRNGTRIVPWRCNITPNCFTLRKELLPTVIWVPFGLTVPLTQSILEHEVGHSPFRYNDAEKALWAKL